MFSPQLFRLGKMDGRLLDYKELCYAPFLDLPAVLCRYDAAWRWRCAG